MWFLKFYSENWSHVWWIVVTINLEKFTKLSGFRSMGIYIFFPTSILVFPLSNCQASELLLSLFPLLIQSPHWFGCLTEESSCILEFTTTFPRHKDVYQGLHLNLIFLVCAEVRRVRPHRWALNSPKCGNHLLYFLEVRFHEEDVVSWTVSLHPLPPHQKRYVSV